MSEVHNDGLLEKNVYFVNIEEGFENIIKYSH